MVALSRKKIYERLTHEDLNKRLFIMPLLDPNEQIGNSSIDLRLDPKLLLFQKVKLSHLDPLTDKYRMLKIYQNMKQEFQIEFGDSFCLHPNEFILGSTLEYIKLPNDLVGFIEGRSSWGRLGLLIHATADLVSPNFQGILTFELSNVGSAPILLYPLMCIGQLILLEASELESNDFLKSKFHNDVGVSLPDFSKDVDFEILSKIKRKYQKSKEKIKGKTTEIEEIDKLKKIALETPKNNIKIKIIDILMIFSEKAIPAITEIANRVPDDDIQEHASEIIRKIREVNSN